VNCWPATSYKPTVDQRWPVPFALTTPQRC
jgi:hypothetical protein